MNLGNTQSRLLLNKVRGFRIKLNNHIMCNHNIFNKSIFLFFFLFSFQIGCKNQTECYLKTENNIYCTVGLIILENESLKNILDSVITFEERKPFYNESSHFIMSMDSFYPNSIFIEALHSYNKRRHLHSRDTLIVFFHNNYLFVLDDNMLTKTGFFSAPKLTVNLPSVKSNKVHSIDDRGTIWKIYIDKDDMQIIDFFKVN